MPGSVYGKIFKVMTWGESHGKAVGAVLDGCPPRLPLTEADIDCWLAERKPGGAYSSSRFEEDCCEILSGIFGGLTTGTPISIIVRNKDCRPSDYEELKNIYRPSHADYSYDMKYGHRDYRGGGRSSGRETIGRVIAGAVAGKALGRYGITLKAYVKSIGGVEINEELFDESEIYKNPLRMPDRCAAERAMELLDTLIEEGDSVGSVVECVIGGLPAGLGEPVFSKLDAEIAKAVMSIGAVKGIEFGSGFSASSLRGTQNNDGFVAENGAIRKTSNNSGGVLGGISDGSNVIFRAAFKPTPSVSKPQSGVSSAGENAELSITGRHDPVIAPRAAVVVKAMAAVAVLDLFLIQESRRAWLTGQSNADIVSRS